MEYYKKIGLGSVQFGLDYGISNSSGITPVDEVTKILTYAKQIGIDTIDTASSYELAESVLGSNSLNSFHIVSKFMPPTVVKKAIRQQFKESVNKLNVDGLYGYLAHRPQDLSASREQWSELTELKNEGKVLKIGYSLNSVEELNLLLDLNFMPDLIQVPFNYFDNRFKESIIYLKENGCEIHTRSCFLQGLFFANTDNLPTYFNELKGTIKMMQNEFGPDLSGILLKYVVSKAYIDKVILGVENTSQLQENLDNLENVKLIPDLEEKISEYILMPSNWPKK